MIRSMTGFGRGESQRNGCRFLVEIRSVNHRFLNTNLRLPREFGALEATLVARCSGRCERGHLDVRVEVEQGDSAEGGGPRLNRDVLDRVLEIVERLEALPGVRGGVDAESLLALPGVVDWEPAPPTLEEEEFLAGASEALDRALDEVVASREAEGRALDRDLRERIATIEKRRAEIAGRAPEREARERQRLVEKIDALLPTRDDELDRRIAQEAVLLADRTDVSEELTRMRAHLDHFLAELETDGGTVGRKLSFLLQELGREANTIAAKANDAEMQQASIEIKAELEKMREQAENVE